MWYNAHVGYHNGRRFRSSDHGGLALQKGGDAPMTAYEILSIVIGVLGILVTLIGIIVKLILAYINAKK